MAKATFTQRCHRLADGRTRLEAESPHDLLTRSRGCKRRQVLDCRELAHTTCGQFSARPTGDRGVGERGFDVVEANLVDEPPHDFVGPFVGRSDVGNTISDLSKLSLLVVRIPHGGGTLPTRLGVEVGKEQRPSNNHIDRRRVE